MESASDLDSELAVSLQSFELRQSHGQKAPAYAASLAEQAKAEGGDEEYRFWKAVEVALTPR